MPRVTDRKKDKWISRLLTAERIYSSVYSEVSECGIEDEQIEFLANLILCFQEAQGEIEGL